MNRNIQIGFSQRIPSMLIGAPQQTHLDEIIMAIEEVVGVSDGLGGQKSILSHDGPKYETLGEYKLS